MRRRRPSPWTVRFTARRHRPRHRRSGTWLDDRGGATARHTGRCPSSPHRSSCSSSACPNAEAFLAAPRPDQAGTSWPPSSGLRRARGWGFARSTAALACGLAVTEAMLGHAHECMPPAAVNPFLSSTRSLRASGFLFGTRIPRRPSVLAVFAFRSGRRSITARCTTAVGVDRYLLSLPHGVLTPADEGSHFRRSSPAPTRPRGDPDLGEEPRPARRPSAPAVVKSPAPAPRATADRISPPSAPRWVKTAMASITHPRPPIQATMRVSSRTPPTGEARAGSGSARRDDRRPSRCRRMGGEEPERVIKVGAAEIQSGSITAVVHVQRHVEVVRST